MVRKGLWAAFAVAAVAVLADRASAGFQLPPQMSAPLPSAVRLAESGPAEEPWGHAVLCRRTERLCAVREGRRPLDAAGAVVLDPGLYGEIVQVQRVVNRAIRPQAEKRGAPDNWKVGGLSGDCEDYALAKRELLVRAGVPSEALRLATGYLSNGDYHAVLVVRTDRGDLVLDNLRTDVRPAERAGLRFETIQSAEPRVWNRVGRADRVLMAGGV